MSTGPQSKLLKWWQTVWNTQMDNAPSLQEAEVATADDQQGSGNLYIAFNVLLAKSKLLEEKTLELKQELSALRLRNERDKKEFMKYAISEFAADMIVVADNIRRALETVSKEQLESLPVLNNLVEGFEVTERSLLTALSRHQVTRFDPLGEPFNPHLHEAKSTENAPNLPADTVVQVIHAGFMIGERLLRPAGVVVAQAGPSTQSAARHGGDRRSSPALSDVVNSERYTRQTDASERCFSVLHKPVITTPEEFPVHRPVGASTPEDWRFDEAQPHQREYVGSPRDWADNSSDYTDASERNRSSFSKQEAEEVTRNSLTSDSAQAIEEAHERTKAVNDAFNSKNYAEAVRLQERIVAEVRFIETAVEGRPGDGTLDTLLSLSWYQLCAEQYDAVIATADMAAAIREDYVSIETNRAHALMLKGCTDEAIHIYNQHRGKETRNKKSWEREVLDDFSELEAANIRHPFMDQIRNSWGAEC